MAENPVPNLNVPNSPKVSDARGTATGAGFTVAVVTEATGTPTTLNNAIVLRQEPTPQARLTAGEVMHLYIAGTGTGGGPKPIESGGDDGKKNAVIAIQFVVILALIVWCFVFGR